MSNENTNNQRSKRMSKKITLDGVEYIPVSEATPPNGNRAVVVVDRGWIFAGDVTHENGRIKLSRAVWVFRWELVGFNGVIANPSDADIREMPNGVDIPEDAEVFRVPVADDWGL